jgi:hypothetical protein
VGEYCEDGRRCIGEGVRVGEGRSTSASADAEETSPEVVGRDSAALPEDNNTPASSLQSSMTESLRD